MTDNAQVTVEEYEGTEVKRLLIATDNGYVRIGENEDGTFYVRDTGLIYEEMNFEEILELIKRIL